MRINRIHSIGGGDFGVSYLHKKSSGKTSVNGKDMEIYIKNSGDAMPDVTEGLVITVKKNLILFDGYFLAFPEGDPLLSVHSCAEGFFVKVIRPGFISVCQSISLWRPIVSSVLTISDKGSRGEREDRSGPALIDMLSDIGSVFQNRAIVPDEKDIIRSKIIEWTEAGSNLILLTGGTGVSRRDVTPEAVLSLTDRVIPGIGEAMRSKTAPSKATAFLSRGLAATYRDALIVALPGSERGAKECFAAVAPILRHAVETLCGWAGECGESRRHR